MTKAELLAAIDSAARVYVWCNVTRDDGWYFKTTKDAARAVVTAAEARDDEFCAFTGKVDNSDTLYIG